MFPDITREDVFRLETRRLWLCWPVAGAIGQTDDRPSPPSLSGPTSPTALPEAASGDPYDVGSGSVEAVEALRRENEAGTALHLMMTGRGTDRQPIGRIALRPVRNRIEDCGLRLQVWMAPPHRGTGLATEAVQALVDTAFMLTDAPMVAASARVLDPGFRRVVEKCGFAYCGTGLDPSRSGGGLVASDRFRLDRKAWVSLKAWRVPGVVRQRPPMSLAPDCPPCG